MAKDTKLRTKQMDEYIDDMNQKMENIYKLTYATTKDNNNDIRSITNDIESNIKQIIRRNSSTDVSNLTRLYSRLKLRQELNNKKTVEGIEEFFNDKNLTNGLLQDYISNKWIKELYNEIDIVCKYMPKLEEALDILKYATLSSDNYSKDFINVSTLNYNQDEQSVFTDKFENLKRKYNLPEKVSEYYDRMSKYGEQFVYAVPYSKEIKRLIDRKENSTRKVYDFNHPSNMSPSYMHEVTVIENDIIKHEDLFESVKSIDSSIADNANVKIIIDNRGFLESAIDSYQDLLNGTKKTDGLSLHEDFIENVVQEAKGFDKTIDDDLEIPKDIDNIASDGLITKAYNPKDNTIKAPGCIIRKLKSENIVPLYVDDDFCLGYYYFEFKNGRSGFDEYSTKLSSRTNMVGDNCTIHRKQQEDGLDYTSKLLDYISGYLSDRIDASFVNKNQDLQKEIYSILKHNDVFNDVSTTDIIKVTFLPAEDVIHFAFEKDPDTHRGISDLMHGLIPAKLWACIYLSDTIGTMTRGQDKRVYYVKQNVETNISQTLLNVISQIKKSNFGLRQIETMNNVLNLVGRFNDYVIPVGQSGESPIQFEVMQGQEINTNTDLLDRLFDEAISGIVPRELLDTAKGVDFAVQITSTNIQFIRKVYNRQSVLENLLSIFFTNVYNYEYGTNIKITCKLPAPLFLQMNNMGQILENTRNYAQTLSELEYSDVQDTDDGRIEQALFTKNLTRHMLSTYIKLDEIDSIKQRSKLEMLAKKKKTQE